MDTSYLADDNDSEITLYVRQLMTALGPLLGVFMAGLSSGYSAVLLPQLHSPRSTDNRNTTSFINDGEKIRVSTIDEESWIASSVVLPMAPGCWLSGYMMESLGRKRSTVILLPMYLIAWLTISLANNVTCLIIGRLISGFCAGLMGPLIPVYISETSDPVLRGVLLSLISMTLSTGILTVHAVGTWLDWRTTAYISVAFAVISCLTCIGARESPTWLVNKGLRDSAIDSWVYLRGWRSLGEYEALENSKKAGRKSVKRSVYSKLGDTLSSRYFLLPLAVLLVFFFTAQFSGFNVVVFYSVDMLKEVTGPENGYIGTLIMDVIRLITSIVVCFLIQYWGRRTLTLLSGYGTAFALFLLSFSLFFDIGRPWFTGVLLMLYTVFLTLGLAPLPWILCGELFPRKFRGLGSGLTSGFAFTCFFVVVKIAPWMFESLEPYGTFMVYGVVSLLGTSFLYFALPETKDKTLQDIERCFDRKSGNNPENGNTEIPMIVRKVNG
ncbi:PREDICTED: facilitated trehalose transporter Tret1-like [Dufourea novaeangliae]|uniref:facilitated trehalose transporter Tret1-like n=1 Tax=Dufourea novaeangliae TaxID=178035 RepID=UPI0007677A12|nr:PREDICTED: facilitated trehalose transporter Tret1-like [Dufourea novaeangliae]